MVFFWAYQQWLSWLALMAVIGLPLLSLLLSLPAMLTARLSFHLPEALTVDTPCALAVQCHSILPTPPWKCKLILDQTPTGQRQKPKPGSALPTEHCGVLTCRVKKAKICDYLGLFSLPIRLPEPQCITVRPIAVPIRQIPELERYLSRAWRPKRGGGFAENHELRLYRPGDSVQQIHWKLSAKTGKLILREPMEPEQGRVLLRLELMSAEDELDRKMGRLLWLGSQLLSKNVRYEIQCLTENGCESWSIFGSDDLSAAIDAILSRKCAPEGSICDRAEAAAWQYYIGGGTDDA